MENLEKLVVELCRLPSETQWLEFKHDNYNPEMIGRSISALANGAALCGKSHAYMLWGVDDKTHEIIGTTENFQTVRKGQTELECWLRTMLSSNVSFEFRTVPIDGCVVGVLKIGPAVNHTVQFQRFDYIRVGSYTKKLNEFPSLQMDVWDKIRNVRFEGLCARADLDLSGILGCLDCSRYFDYKGLAFPADITQVAHYLMEEGVLSRQDNGLYEVANLGAILLAKRLNEFPQIERKAIRVVRFRGDSRNEMIQEQQFDSGYAACFSEVLRYVETLTVIDEPIVGVERKKRIAYPSIALREIIANALIHQDFSISGAGPVIEVFASRIEITNPGSPLIDINRFIDNPPRSRNEKLASLMRRLHLCEELGTGWDKIVIACEQMQIPAPRIEIFEDCTRITLFAQEKFSNLSRDDRVWACYLHACIKYVQHEYLTNTSLRGRFGLKDSASANVSRIIKETVRQGLVKSVDPKTAPRYMRYQPFWA